MTSVETRVALTVKTNSAGEWLVQNLLPGHYRFGVTQSGFVTTEHQPIELQVSDRKLIDTVLTVGGQNEVVTVEGTMPLIETTAAVQGTVITQKQLEELPSQTNVATLLAGLTPGRHHRKLYRYIWPPLVERFGFGSHGERLGFRYARHQLPT